VSEPLEEDRFLQPEVTAVIDLVRSNKIWETVEPHIERMGRLESHLPEVLRHDADSPTAAALDPLL